MKDGGGKHALPAPVALAGCSPLVVPPKPARAGAAKPAASLAAAEHRA